MHTQQHNCVFQLHTASLLWRHKLWWTQWTRKQLAHASLLASSVVRQAAITTTSPQTHTQTARVTSPSVFLPSCFLARVYFGHVPGPYRKWFSHYISVCDCVCLSGILIRKFLSDIWGHLWNFLGDDCCTKLRIHSQTQCPTMSDISSCCLNSDVLMS